MSDSYACVAALKDTVRIVRAAEVNADVCDRAAGIAQVELLDAREKYRTALDALRTQLTLEVMGEMSDDEFIKGKDVPHA